MKSLNGGPFSGLRILDTSSLAPGNYASLVMSRLGAEVLKVERPLGDPIRRSGDKNAEPFIALNAGKKSVVLDLKTDQGQAAFDNLLETSDVVVENYLPKTAISLGVTYERISSVNASVVLCSIAGFGSASPRHSLPGHDLNFWSEAGALAFVQPPDQLGFVPQLPVSDMLGGVTAGFAMASALFQRSFSGRGAHVRISLADTLLHGWMGLGLPQDTLSDLGSAGYGIYWTADDRRLAVAVEEDHYWEAFCEVIGQPELAIEDHLCAGVASSALRQRVQIALKGKPLDKWLRVMSARGLPVNEVLSPNQALVASLRSGSKVVQEVDGAGDPKYVAGSLFEMSTFSASAPKPAPSLDQHGREFLESFNKDSR